MGLSHVRELTLRQNLTEVYLPDMHIEVMLRIATGQGAHEMGVVLDEYLA